MADYNKVIAENKERLKKIHSPYLPLIGKGSPTERFPFYIDYDTELWLPEAMKEHPLVQAAHEYEALTDFLKFCYKHTIPSERVAGIRNNINAFHKERLSYDFEFWASSCAKIQDKKGKHIPFILNIPQRKLLRELEKMRLAGVPIRVILLKARQWGGSTLLRLYMSWIQLFLKTGWGAAIIASVESQAMHIRGMFDVVSMHHPAEIFKIKLKPYRGSQKNREIEGRNCVIGIGSYEEPDNLRSFTFQMIHLSEIAFWSKTMTKTPETIIQALRSTVPRLPYSLIALESTANGVGNFFHREWVKAKEGGGYCPVFIPWFDNVEYSMPIEERNYRSFIESMTSDDWERWELGATLEGILWYRTFMSEENYTKEQMQAEFPSSAEEAFVTSGQRVFPAKYVRRIRKNCIDPEFVGELHGNTVTGRDSLRGLEFHDNPKGNLWIWQKPDISEPKITNRYVVFVDIGGRTAKADYSVIRVLDRYWMIEGGKPEFVATWKGHIDHDLLAWKAAQIALWYDNGFLAIEDNSLDWSDDDGSGHFFTILNEIAEHYDNMFARYDPDRIQEGIPIRYGFSTNRKTKPMIIDTLLAAARDDEYVERDVRACDEMDTFEQKPNKKLGAQEGCKDDMVISTAGDVWVATKYLDPPAYIKPEDKPKKKAIIGEASM